MCELLKELNEDVEGTYLDEIPEHKELLHFIDKNKF